MRLATARVEMRLLASRSLKVGLGLAVSAVCVWFFAAELDFAALAAAFAPLSATTVALAASCLAAGYALRTVRWWWMLRALAPALPLRRCIAPLLAGTAVNNVLPLRAGDALRVLAFRRALQIPPMRVLGTLLIERALDFAVLVGFLHLGLLALPGGAIAERFVAWATWLGAGAVAALALAVLLAPRLARLLAALPERRIFGRRLPAGIGRHGAELAEALGLVRSSGMAAGLLGLSVLAWTCEGGVFALIARELYAEGAQGGWFALATGTLATLLPSSPGYIGTFDVFAAAGLRAFGAPEAVAAAFALTVHAILWLPLTAVGLLCLLRHALTGAGGGRRGAPAAPP